jgi:TM2 domain-containing membrane protein YozV
VSLPVNRLHPVLAALLSLLAFPGAGQLYNRQPHKAATFLAVAVGGVNAVALGSGALRMVLLYFVAVAGWAAVEAYLTARKRVRVSPAATRPRPAARPGPAAG